MTVYLVRRDTKRRGVVWHVRYEQGRNAPIVHLGVFTTRTAALLRKQAAEELVARGIYPERILLEPSRAAPVVTLREVTDAWLASRVDVAAATIRNYRHSIADLPAEWLREAPEAVTFEAVQAWLGELGGRLSPGVLQMRLLTLRMILDYALVAPNPAADRRVRLPKRKRRHYRLPTRAELERLRAAMPRHAELLEVLEHGGLRIGEAHQLRWSDIDAGRGRIRVAEAKTASGVRWVGQLDGRPRLPVRPPEAADEDRVFAYLSSTEAARNALRYACRGLGIRHYSPHDLRHLHASRLLHDGKLSPAEIAARLGHANAGITLGAYVHVVPPD